MDTPLTKQFRNVVSLASLAFIFSSIHALQYSLRDYDTGTSMDDTENPQDTVGASTSHSNFTSTPSQDTTQASTSNPAEFSSTGKSGKAAAASGRWSDLEITQLLDYIQEHCSLNTSSGLSLKKTCFNQASDTLKSKTAAQCRNKWNNVRIFIINEGLSR